MHGQRTTRRLALAAALTACSLVVTVGVSLAAPAQKSKAIVAPPKIGAFAPQSANKLMKSNDNGKKQIARNALWNHHSAQDVSKAYGGADALVESYANANLEILFSLVAVRAATPGVFALYSDPKFLQLARPFREVDHFGAVSCLVQNDATPAGQQPAPTTVHTVLCQRSGPHLTVMVSNFGDSLGNRPSAVAAVVSQAWQLISAE